MHATNSRGLKKNWVPMFKKINCDIGMLDNSNSKCHINNECSNYMTEDINMFSYFTPTK